MIVANMYASVAWPLGRQAYPGVWIMGCMRPEYSIGRGQANACLTRITQSIAN